MTEPAPVTPLRLRPRDRDAIVSSLRAGVVPRRGFAHIQVGRADEVTAIGRDLDRVADGGSMVRFVIGDYGAGKTFFLNLAASMAAEKKLVTAAADLTPDRRLHATGGQARGLYAELMRNLSTRSTPELLMDTRRGLYSYDALRSRLAENSFAVGGLADYTGPVLRLANLAPEDLFLLLGKG